MFGVLILGIASVMLGIVGSSAVAMMSIGLTWIGISFIAWNTATAIGFISFIVLYPAAQPKRVECRVPVRSQRR